MTKRTSEYNRAMDWMRKPDARMVLTNHNGRPDYWITPGGGFRVDPEIAQKIIAHPPVRGGKDALFPGLDQTWRLRREFGGWVVTRLRGARKTLHFVGLFVARLH